MTSNIAGGQKARRILFLEKRDRMAGPQMCLLNLQILAPTLYRWRIQVLIQQSAVGSRLMKPKLASPPKPQSSICTKQAFLHWIQIKTRHAGSCRFHASRNICQLDPTGLSSREYPSIFSASRRLLYAVRFGVSIIKQVRTEFVTERQTVTKLCGRSEEGKAGGSGVRRERRNGRKEGKGGNEREKQGGRERTLDGWLYAGREG
jgi:hypothetical protein